MKLPIFCILTFSILSIFAQSWQSAYDSCLKYQEKRQYKKAVEWGDKVLELYEKQVQVKDTNYSNILNAQFENCYYAGLYKQGEFYAKKDSAWTKEKDKVRYGYSCNNLALLYKGQGKYTEAEVLYKEAKEIFAKVLGKEHLDYAISCNNLAGLYTDQGKYAEAELLFKEAKEIRAKVLGKEHPDYANSCNNLATLYLNQGKHVEAELLFKEAKEIRAKVLGKENPNYAQSCNNLALLYRVQGKYAESELLYKEAREIRAKVLGKEHPDYAQSCNGLATLYYAQGKYAEAEVLYKESKEIRAKVLGKEHTDYISSCNNLALLYKDQGKYADAEPLFKEAKEICARVLGKEHPLYATYSSNLAGLYYAQDKYTDAEPLYKEAKEICIKVLGKEHPLYANSCNNLAALYQVQGKYVDSELLFKEAKEIRAKVLGKEHPDYANSCNNLASLYQTRNQYEIAEALFLEAIQIKLKEIESNFKILSEEEKEKYIQANINRYLNSFQNFALKRYAQNPVITQESYNLILQTKGLILQSTEKIKNRILNSKDEELKKLYVEWKLTKDKYAKAQNLTYNERKQKKINLDSLAQQANELEKQLALKSEDFAYTFVPKPITWKDIQNKLTKNQAAIEIVQVEANKDSVVYFGLLITKWSKYPELILLPYGNMLEKQFFINYYRSTRHKILDPYSYNAFWKAFADKLKDIKQVFFSPDGIYYKINVSTLYNVEQNRYVFDEVEVINVTNSKDLLEKKSVASKNSYLIGNPKFNLELDTKDNEKPIEQRSIENLSQLEGAEREVKQICNFLSNAVTVTGADATEEFIKSLKNPRVLHIATHGYFKKGQYQSSTQAMLNAGLLFAGVVDYDRMEMRPLDKEDGKLTAFEVMNMELDSTELVVLSACETGLGQASKEGVYGLQRAFKVAGAQSIIMSLWKVNDEATQLLMTKFYENWQKKGMHKRKAFEAAQKEIRKQYKEPYYWGAFVMIE
ncbi:MAG: tetratricopeptide repeat protein [Bacteroidia bacterium]|nr:tetratricopeptide repeat protein [Bacteroidia bacterium]